MVRTIISLGAVCTILCSSPALAQSASSSAYALGAQETVTAPLIPNVNVTVGPVAATSGSAPPSYNVSNSVASVTESAALVGNPLSVGQNLNTGLLTSNSTGSATGAQATATVDNASLGIGGVLFLPNYFNLAATTVQSFSQANSVGGLDASGSTTIEGLTVSGTALGSLFIDGSLFVNPDPNTILLNIAGLKIILNEQILSGDGTTGIGIATNAIHASFTNFPVGVGLTNGDIVIGHTQAFASVGGQTGAVPEPSTWAMMLIGFGAVGYGLRKRGSRSLALAA